MGIMDLPKNHGTQAAASYPAKPAHDTGEEQLARVLHEEITGLIHQAEALLPDIQGGLQEPLYDTLRQNSLNVLKRCRVLPGDHNGETTRCSPKAVADILYASGGAGKFNTGEIENAAARADDLETYANSVLRADGGVGALLNGNNVCAIVKCAFMDNPYKPVTVTDVRLAVNIPDSALIGAAFYDCALVRYIVRELIGTQIVAGITDISAEGQDGQAIGEALAERVAGLCSAIDPGICERIDKLADIDDIRDLGFGMASRSLALMLDSAKMPYQFIDCRKKERELDICEYEDNSANLPDEHYRIHLRYIDQARLEQERAAYDEEVNRFNQAIQQIWNLVEVIYQDSKSIFKVHDFEDLAKKNKGRVQTLLGDKAAGFSAPVRDVFSPQEKARAAIARMYARMHNIHRSVDTKEWGIMEERLARLKTECARIEQMINPHHLYAGILVDIELSSIKRKRTTLDSMAAVLNEFLAKVSADFREAAVAVFGDAPQEPHTKATKTQRR